MPFVPTVSLILASLIMQAAPPQPQAFTLDSQLQNQFSRSERLLKGIADRMPEDLYGFRPTPDVRTFGANVLHTAATAFGMCANLVGQPIPQKPADIEKLAADKATATKVLGEAFAFCDSYVKSLTPATLGDSYSATAVGQRGQRSAITVTKVGLLSNLLQHNAEMYGYMAVYLRLKGLVPPSSDPPKAPAK